MAFRFGRNWREYARFVTGADVADACRDLERLTGPLAGRDFLDIGCGSGMSSVAALRLGARRVVAFDLDPLSVEAGRFLLERFAAGGPWAVRSGSVLDPAFLSSVGGADVVHSWGVLHHTGRMWRALECAASAVRPGGALCVALYNRTPGSAMWRAVKRLGASAPEPIRAALAALLFLPRAAFRAAGGRNPLRDRRGMSLWHDAVDWIGGFPFEVASPDEVVAFLGARGFECRTFIPARGTGCNEFAFVSDPGGRGGSGCPRA
ncbi:MAG: class I SAM-dependent methyltransferase [Planctomycetes bacterium]|nr:class I SAM-dependent methyltransferase [Planctomycetota bacterium]